jgi:chorismate-pyruvate lyase
MNPLDELRALTDLYPASEPLFVRADHIPSSVTPEPYKTMLVHEHHMTIAMETYHRSPVDVRVLARQHEGDVYARKIVLLKHGGETVVQFGIFRFNLSYVTEPVRREIIAGKTPLGRILINHNVLRHIDLGAILEITAGPELARLLHMPQGAVTYGRLATIFCNRQPAVDLLEISAPLVGGPTS